MTSGKAGRQVLSLISSNISKLRSLGRDELRVFSLLPSSKQMMVQYPIHDGVVQEMLCYPALASSSGSLSGGGPSFPESVLFSGFGGGRDALRCGEFHTLDSSLLPCLLPQGSQVREE